MKNLNDLLDNSDFEEEPSYLGDGVYLSSKAPETHNAHKAKDLYIEPDKDFYAAPYDTDQIFIWRGEKPLDITKQSKGECNHGCALVINVTQPGFVTVCAEND